MQNPRKYRICFVGSSIEGKEEAENSTRLFVEAAKEMNIELTNIRKGSIKAYFAQNEIKFYDQNLNLEDQDAFIFRDITGLVDPKTKERTRIFQEVTLFAKYLHNTLHKPIFDSYILSDDPSYTKFKHGIILSQAGLPTIPTWTFFTKLEVQKHISFIQYPIIIKPANGARGKGVMRFENAEQFSLYLMQDYTSSIFYPNLIQQAIDNNGDYRVVVLGDKVIATLQKHRKEENVVANMSFGNSAELIEPDDELKNLAIQATRAVGMEFAGVDIIEDKNSGKRYILEVNMSPQIYYSSRFSGKNLAKDIFNYIIGKIEQ